MKDRTLDYMNIILAALLISSAVKLERWDTIIFIIGIALLGFAIKGRD